MELKETVNYEDKLKKLNDKRSDLISRKAKLDVQYDNAKVERENLEKQLIDLGSTKETLDTDIANAEKELTELLYKYEEELKQVETLIGQAEGALTSNA